MGAFRPWKFLEQRASSKRYSYLRDALLSLAMAALGILAALLIVEPYRPVRGDPIREIEIGKLEIDTGNRRPASLLLLARSRLYSTVTLQGRGVVHRTRWSHLGAVFDLEWASKIIEAFATENSPTVRYFREEKQGTPPAIPMPLKLDSEAAVESLIALKDMIDRKPRNAAFDFLKDSVVPEEHGISLDVYETLAALDRALAEGGSLVELVLEEVPAAITKEDLADIDVRETVGFFETRYSRMRKDRNRTHNVRLGASKLDGQVIMPGQVFSLNDTLGDRSQARGFRYAPVIAGGVLVEGMGGGTCQVASTLYASAFFSGLVIVDRRPHSRPSSYIKLGLDATVSYPSIDLQLKNPFDFPVVINFTAKDGVLRSEIRGKTRPYVVTFLRRVVGQTPYPTRVIDDSLLEKGVEVVTQNGIPGYTVLRYQILERDKVGYRFQTIDKYPPTTEFVHRGTRGSKDASSKPGDSDEIPKPDMHKPYRASNHLRMVQGPGSVFYEQSHK